MDEHSPRSGTAAGSERFFYGWFIVAILFFISIIDGGFTYTFSTFLRPLTEDFGWSRAETAGAFSLYLFVAGLVLPLWGWLIDHVGARWVFVLSALIDGIALALLSTVHSLTTFYALYLVLGVGLAGIGPMPVGKVITQWFVAKRGLAMGIALVGTSGGGLVLVPLAGFLIAEYSWRVAYQGLAVLSLGVMLPLVWFFLVETPQEKGLKPLGQDSPAGDAVEASQKQEQAQDATDWTLRQALSTPTFWLLGLALCLGLMAATAVNTHQVAYLQDAGLSLELASTLAGVTLGMSMGGRFGAGWASEHVPNPHHILAVFLLMQVVGIGFVLGLHVFGFWVLAVFVPLFGLGFGGMVVLWPLTVSHDFGQRSFGTIAGVLGTVILCIGGALGPVIAGAIYDSTGSYDWAFVASIGVLLVGAGAAFAAPDLGTAHSGVTLGSVIDLEQET